jgi:predicted dehydrogenase
MSQTRLRWGILGISSFNAQTIAQSIEASVTGVLVAIAGTPEGAKKFGDTFVEIKSSAKDISVYYKYEKLLADRNVDAVYITLSGDKLYEWIIKAIKAKKHILCEPLCGLSSEEMQDIINKVDAAKNIFCMEAMLYHYHPFYEKLKTIIVKDKLLGDIRFYNATYTMNLSADDIQNKTGGFFNVGYYPLSLIRHLIDEEPIAIYENGTMQNDTDAILNLRFSNGVKATVHAASDINMSWQFHVTGTKGTLTIISNPWLPGNTTTYYLTHVDPNRLNISIASDLIEDYYKSKDYILHCYGIDMLAECVQNKALSSNAVTLKHTLGNIKIIEDWRKMVKENQPQQEKSHDQHTLASVRYFKNRPVDEKTVSTTTQLEHSNKP